MTSIPPHAANKQTTPSTYEIAFGAFFGAFLGLSMLKFGNPVIMERWVSSPADIYEFILSSPWPISWAYVLLGLVLFAAIPLLRRGLPARHPSHRGNPPSRKSSF